VALNRKTILFCALLVILSVFLGCTTQQTASTASITPQDLVHFSVVLKDDYNSIVFSESSSIAKGSTAFEAMRSLADLNIVYEQYAFGPFIKGLGNKVAISPDNNLYWSLYVDGNYADKGINDYKLNSDTNILWALEKIQIN